MKKESRQVKLRAEKMRPTPPAAAGTRGGGRSRRVQLPLALQIAAAVRRSLNTPRLRVAASRVSTRNVNRWRVTLHERRRTSEAVLLDASAVAVIRKIGLVPPEYHGDLRIALAGIREDWNKGHGP